MNYIVLDLEWNQCPKGKQYEIRQMPFEIIEIGAVRLDDSLRIVDSFHEYIAPKAYRKLHYMTKSVINITEKDLEGKRSFPQVASDFMAWCGPDPYFCTWGSSDLLELQRNYSWHRMESPFAFPLFYCDIQKVFSITYEERHMRRSLEYAVDYLHIDKTERFHGAYSDAWYTAQVAAFLKAQDLKDNFSVDYYRTPENRSEEISLCFDSYSKFISKPFESKQKAFADRKVSASICCVCHASCKKKVRWFQSGSKNFLSLAWCPEHGWLKGKIRMRQRADGSFYVIKTQRLATDEEALEIKLKREAQAKRQKLQ